VLAEKRKEDYGVETGWIAAGECIREATPPDAVVLYLVADLDWNPAPLYFAQRDGHNLTPERLQTTLYRNLIERARRAGRPVFVFAPADLEEQCQRHRGDLALESVARSKWGDLWHVGQ